MKIRSGFVSNSSSSSFIVAFDKLPENAAELREMMFGDKELVAAYDIPAKTEDLADIVFADIQNQLGKLPHSREDILDDFANPAHWEIYERRDRSCYKCRGDMTEKEKAEADRRYERENAEALQLQEQWTDEILKEYEGKTILRFGYEDKGATTILECGDVFHNFMYRKINNH